MKRIAVLVSSSPTSDNARRAFTLAADLAEEGHKVTLALLEDATLAGTTADLGLPVGKCESILVLTSDLRLRGFDETSLIPGCAGGTYGDLVTLIMEGSDQALGAF